MGSRSERPTSFGKAPPLALVVEDDEAIRALEERILRVLGCEVIVAGSAAVARTICDNRPRLAVAIVDLQLPDGDGLALVTELRDLLRDRAPPFVVLSGRVVDGSAPPEGVTALVGKPFTMDRLMHAVKDAIGPRSARCSGS